MRGVGAVDHVVARRDTGLAIGALDPIEAVALEVGYQDASFFSRLFRRKVGLSPAQYRRRFGALAGRLQQAATRAR